MSSLAPIRGSRGSMRASQAHMQVTDLMPDTSLLSATKRVSLIAYLHDLGKFAKRAAATNGLSRWVRGR
jgi:hypothetical protein